MSRKNEQYGFTIADLERRKKETGYGYTDQMNEDLSAAVSNGSTGHVVDRVPLEYEEQAAFVQWCRDHADEYPGLDAMYAIPNGGYRPTRTGVTMKQTGTLAGVPDIFIPVPISYVKDVYPMTLSWRHGLYIEMKRRQKSLSRVSAEQAAIIERLRGLGYYVAVCYGCDEAIDVVQRYFDGSL